MKEAPTLTDELDRFLDELRRDGYNIGLQEFIDVHDLLVTLESRGRTPRDLAGLGPFIGPLICNTPQQQSDFQRRWATWATRSGALWVRPPDPATPTPPSIIEVERELEQESRWARWRDRVVNAVMLIVLGATAVSAFRSEFQERADPPALPVDTARVEPPPVQLDSIGLVTPAPDPGTGLEAFRDFWVGVASWTVEHVSHVRWILLGSLGVIALVLIGRWAFSRWLARRFLSMRLVRDTPSVAHLVTRGEDLPPFDGRLLFRAAQNFRLHRRIGARYLDHEATVGRSVEKAGWYSPVERHRLTVPEYLFLIDRTGERDHQARMYARLADWLVSLGVLVDRYSFDGDPRVCIPEVRGVAADARPATLDELVASHANHRLVVFAEAGVLLSPFSGELERWAHRFEAWPLRALLTPEPPEAWGAGEETLRRAGWLVFPGSEEGIHALVEHPDVLETWGEGRGSSGRGLPLPSLLREEPARWTDRYEPLPEEMEELVADLRLYLGDVAFRWLSACAVFPELHWHLTVAVGRGLIDSGGQPLLSEDRLLALSRLPWFREGRMPLWLRDRLLRGLTARERSEAESAFNAVLETAVIDPESPDVLDVALRNPVPDLGRHILRHLQAGEPEESPLREQLFSSFMGTRLAFTLPAAVRDLLRSGTVGVLSEAARALRRTVRISLPFVWLSVAMALVAASDRLDWIWIPLLATVGFSLPALVLGWVGQNRWAVGLGAGNLVVGMGATVQFVTDYADLTDQTPAWVYGVWLVASSLLYLLAWTRWPATPLAVLESRAVRVVRPLLGVVLVSVPYSVVGWAVALADGPVPVLFGFAFLPLALGLGVCLRRLGVSTSLPKVRTAGTAAALGLFSPLFGFAGVVVWALSAMAFAARARRGVAGAWKPLPAGGSPWAEIWPGRWGAMIRGVVFAVGALVVVLLLEWVVSRFPLPIISSFNPLGVIG